MFTGIIETQGKVVDIKEELDNKHFTLESSITEELKIDQSLAHNGVCLTVIAIEGNKYTVTAVAETLQRSNLGLLSVGDKVNLERSMKLGARLDGHMVQGHVDTTAKVIKIEPCEGSTKFYFQTEKTLQPTVEKGSITINGVSLTVVDSNSDTFSVVIIPYTIEHTNFKNFEIGTLVNIEYDIIGKYVAKLIPSYQQ